MNFKVGDRIEYVGTSANIERGARGVIVNIDATIWRTSICPLRIEWDKPHPIYYIYLASAKLYKRSLRL